MFLFTVFGISLKNLTIFDIGHPPSGAPFNIVNLAILLGLLFSSNIVAFGGKGKISKLKMTFIEISIIPGVPKKSYQT